MPVLSEVEVRVGGKRNQYCVVTSYCIHTSHNYSQLILLVIYQFEKLLPNGFGCLSANQQETAGILYFSASSASLRGIFFARWGVEVAVK